MRGVIERSEVISRSPTHPGREFLLLPTAGRGRRQNINTHPTRDFVDRSLTGCAIVKRRPPLLVPNPEIMQTAPLQAGPVQSLAGRRPAHHCLQLSVMFFSYTLLCGCWIFSKRLFCAAKCIDASRHHRCRGGTTAKRV